MKMDYSTIGVVALLMGGLGPTSPAMAQPVLQRLEQQIREQAGPEAAVPPGGAAMPRVSRGPSGQRPYLGGLVDDSTDRGRGVRVLGVRAGGPADRAGLKAQDLIVGAAGARVRQMADLTSVLDLFSPGDKVTLDIIRDGRPQKIDLTLGRAPNNSDRSKDAIPETIPPPPAEGVPSDSAVVPPGPALLPPPTGDTARVDQLQRRIEQLERRVEELERALAEARKK